LDGKGDDVQLCQNLPGIPQCLNVWYKKLSLNLSDSMRWTCGIGNSMSLTFQGSDITWFGGTGYFTTDTLANVTVDDGPVTQINQAGKIALDRQQLFRQTGLDPSKNHTLTIVFAGPTPEEGRLSTCIQSDYFEYVAAPAPSVTTSPNPTNTPSTREDTTFSNHSAVNAGVIVGCVIGIICGISLIGVVVFFYLSRRRKQERQVHMMRPPQVQSKVRGLEPYDLESQITLGTRIYNIRHQSVSTITTTRSGGLGHQKSPVRPSGDTEVSAPPSYTP
jgi:hypothetical protein